LSSNAGDVRPCVKIFKPCILSNPGDTFEKKKKERKGKGEFDRKINFRSKMRGQTLSLIFPYFFTDVC